MWIFYDTENMDFGSRSEQLVHEIFKAWGYAVTTVKEKNTAFDMIAEKKDKKYVIEVKAARNLLYSGQYAMQAVQKLKNAAEAEGGIPVLVALNQMRESLKAMLHKFDPLEILDIHNLLYMVKDNDKLKSELLAFLNYSVDNIEIVKPNIVQPNEKS